MKQANRLHLLTYSAIDAHKEEIRNSYEKVIDLMITEAKNRRFEIRIPDTLQQEVKDLLADELFDISYSGMGDEDYRGPAVGLMHISWDRASAIEEWESGREWKK